MKDSHGRRRRGAPEPPMGFEECAHIDAEGCGEHAVPEADHSAARPGSSNAAAPTIGPRRAAAARHERLRLVAAALAAAAVAVVLYLFLFAFVDDGLNGAFVDWFFSTFVRSWEVDPTTGITYNVVFNAAGAKDFFLRLGLVWVLVLVASCALAAWWYGRRRERATIAEASELLAFYMRRDVEATEVFPAGYAKLALQAAELKADRAARDRALRDEAARKNDLITYLAHDLKTPLTSVIGYLSLLSEIPEMPLEQRCRYTGVALDKARRLERLINEFFDITRYNLSHLELEVEAVDLSFLLVQLAEEFYPVLAAHGNRLALTIAGRAVSTDDPGPSFMIMADPGRLARVFNNVIKNAIAYSRAGTTIEVTVERVASPDADAATSDAPAPVAGAARAGSEGARGAAASRADAGVSAGSASAPGSGWARIRVADEGATIPPHKLEAIFDKFFRLDEARASTTGGAGLGLAIAREIVQLHGGRIAAASSAGRTVFTIELPA